MKYLILLLLACLVFIQACTSNQEEQQNWNHYKHLFFSGESIIDAVNGNIRHSEGQGVGMLFAVQNQDKKTFDEIWGWTKINLQIREKDHLLAWSWNPEAPHVRDYNNATDGDILVAWALLRGFEEWGDKDYKSDAVKMIDDIRKLLVVQKYGRLLLLPGLQGFTKEEGITINPSYWVFPAFQLFAQLQPDEQVWPNLIQSGLNLLRDASFGAWSLPPDWLLVGDNLSPAKQFPEHFGLDAVRIPLYLIWGRYYEHSTVVHSNRFWSQFTGEGAWPEWGGLVDTNIHMADTMQGVQNVAAFASCHLKEKFCANEIKLYWDHGEYYQVTLQFLTRLAEKDLLQ